MDDTGLQLYDNVLQNFCDNHKNYDIIVPFNNILLVTSHRKKSPRIFKCVHSMFCHDCSVCKHSNNHNMIHFYYGEDNDMTAQHSLSLEDTVQLLGQKKYRGLIARVDDTGSKLYYDVLQHFCDNHVNDNIIVPFNIIILAESKGLTPVVFFRDIQNKVSATKLQ